MDEVGRWCTVRSHINSCLSSYSYLYLQISPLSPSPRHSSRVGDNKLYRAAFINHLSNLWHTPSAKSSPLCTVSPYGKGYWGYRVQYRSVRWITAAKSADKTALVRLLSPARCCHQLYERQVQLTHAIEGRCDQDRNLLMRGGLPASGPSSIIIHSKT